MSVVPSVNGEQQNTFVNIAYASSRPLVALVKGVEHLPLHRVPATTNYFPLYIYLQQLKHPVKFNLRRETSRRQ